jgi:hypothetical protein
MSSPSSVTSPVTRQTSMVSFMRLRQRKKVDLPQPDGPISADIKQRLLFAVEDADVGAAHLDGGFLDGSIHRFFSRRFRHDVHLRLPFNSFSIFRAWLIQR